MNIVQKPVNIVITKDELETDTGFLKYSVQFRKAKIAKALNIAIAIAEFYRKYPSSMVMEKNEIQIMGQMQKKSVFSAKIDGIHENMVACSVVWEHYMPVRVDGENIHMQRFIEPGTMLSVLNKYNMQSIMHALRFFDVLITDPAGIYFGATYGDNVPSQTNLVKNMNFSSWANPPAELKCARLTYLREHDEEHRGVEWFRPTVGTVVKLASCLNDVFSNPLRTRNVPPEERSKPFGEQHYDSVNLEILIPNLDTLKMVCEEIAQCNPRDIAGVESILGTALPEGFLAP